MDIGFVALLLQQSLNAIGYYVSPYPGPASNGIVLMELQSRSKWPRNKIPWWKHCKPRRGPQMNGSTALLGLPLWICMYMYVHVYTYTCIYVTMYIYICVYNRFCTPKSWKNLMKQQHHRFLGPELITQVMNHWWVDVRPAKSMFVRLTLCMCICIYINVGTDKSNDLDHFAKEALGRSEIT